MFKKGYFLAFLFAFCSIIYELLVANLLSYITGKQVLYQTVSMATFILGMGIGSLLSDKISKEKSCSFLIKTELSISFIVPFFLSLIFIISLMYNYYDFFLTLVGSKEPLIQKLNYVYIIVSQLMIIVIGFLTGFEIPLLIKNYEVSESKVFFFNYLGILIGTLLFSFILVPLLKIYEIIFIITSINIISLFLISNNNFVFFIFFMFYNSLFNYFVLNNTENLYYKGIYSFAQMNIRDNSWEKFKFILDRNEIITHKSPYQRIDIIKDQNYKQMGNIYSPSGELVESFVKNPEFTYTLYIDKKFQFSNTNEMYYHQGFSHVPITIHNKIPKKILVLGGGDGLLVKELLRYKEVERIDLIELDQMVINLAKNGDLAMLNEQSLYNKRVSVKIADAFREIKSLKEKKIKYDAVFIDFPYPNSHDLAKLYSIEFYKNIIHIMNNDSFLVLDAPIIPHNKIQNSIMISTLSFSGFKTILPYIADEEPFIMVYMNDEKIDVNEIDFSKNNMFDPNFLKKIEKLKKTEYDFEINKKFINSIFKITF